MPESTVEYTAFIFLKEHGPTCSDKQYSGFEVMQDVTYAHLFTSNYDSMLRQSCLAQLPTVLRAGDRSPTGEESRGWRKRGVERRPFPGALLDGETLPPLAIWLRRPMAKGMAAGRLYEDVHCC